MQPKEAKEILDEVCQEVDETMKSIIVGTIPYTHGGGADTLAYHINPDINAVKDVTLEGASS